MSGRSAVSVVICAHSAQRREQLKAALNSLGGQSIQPREIIAVIDHNVELLAMVAEQFPTVRAAASTRRPGLSGARNVGIEQARGEIVAFMDDDALAPTDWLERMIGHYDDPRVLAVGGAVAAAWPDGRPSWFPAEFDWVVGCSYKGQPEEVATVRNLLGCNMSFRRAVFERAGGFSEQLGRGGNDAAGCEESELCIRATRHFPGARIVYDPGLVVSHQISPERVTRAYFRTRCKAEGRSKALMVGSTGTSSGLSSERSYVLRTLPAGFARGIGNAFRGADWSGIARASAIAVGLAYVSASYLGGRLAGNGRRAPRHVVSTFAPLRVADVDLARPRDRVDPVDGKTGRQFGGAFCLVRDGGRPIGVVEVPLFGRKVEARQLRKALAATPASALPRRIEDDEAQFARVVVATRDRPEALARCLDSLLQQDYGPFEVVVVDNAPSSSETADMIAGRYGATGRIRYRREDTPGLGHAHNAGIADAIAPFIAFTDDDVIVDPQWLRVMASNFTASPEVGCVTGLILPVELETRAQYWTERQGGFGKGFDRRVFDLAENRPSDPLFPFAAGSFGSGANMAFRTSVLQAQGGFDSALGAGTLARGGDDLAAFVSVIRAGHQLVYDPGALVWHHHRRSEEGIERQAYGYGVGLGAYLSKTLVDDPAALLQFLRAAPWAIAHLLNPGSSKNARLPEDYPAALQWRERLGIAAGFPAYIRSRSALRRRLRETREGSEYMEADGGALGKP
ncbi:glycosyltransferase [Devosia nitrariae]|uniref:Glycosyltransferase 2-like domain-containing protein n=1 Tax=Devosia nitrariae TaxID=2071872 RepID=A0ABQ5W106_9HYPH|nr:glycosyltransferase [Devosia nitrariae]GLQ53556.1 hypothetical protein GCM10010862_08150 [Devosia nitrariae]